MSTETKPITASEAPKPSKSGRWFAGYIVAGIIWYLGQSFYSTPFDGIFILAVAILCGVFYHRLKAKIKIKSEFLRIIVTFFILEIIAGALIGFFTRLF